MKGLGIAVLCCPASLGLVRFERISASVRGNHWSYRGDIRKGEVYERSERETVSKLPMLLWHIVRVTNFDYWPQVYS